MIGTWKSRNATTLPENVTNTIQINDVSRESFTGIRIIKLNNGSQDSTSISISGTFAGRGLYVQDGAVLHKNEQVNAQLPDCAACTQESKMIIHHDSIMLVISISNCDNKCNGEIYYYKLLSEYDDETQRYLVDRFGRPSDIIGFQPFHPREDTTIASNNNDSTVEAIKKQKEGRRQDSLDNIARIKQQQRDESIRIAQQKKLQQEITDSLNLLQQKEKRRIKDSLDNVAKLEKIKLRTEDSLHDVQAKMRQQAIIDSIHLVKQNEQQRLKDSLGNVFRIRQQQINDSILLAQQKKRQQEIADSINLVKQKEQQHINDSLQNVAATNLQKQRTEDSLHTLQAKKRQQEITDSLAAVRKQQYNDSLQKAALAKAVPPIISDSNQTNKVLTTRTSILLGTYHITSPDILIELFDNGEIDGDRVSVYHNNAIIVSNQTLGLQPITINIHADITNREHEFVLVAENLGSIPPNSALMRITAGKQVYKLTVNTDMKTNARIVFIYDGN